MGVDERGETRTRIDGFGDRYSTVEIPSRPSHSKETKECINEKERMTDVVLNQIKLLDEFVPKSHNLQVTWLLHRSA
jgi:hypothetical protein